MHNWRIGTSATVIIVMIVWVTVFIPVSVMSVVIGMIIIMIPMVIVPVKWVPRTPVRWIIAVIPG